MLSLRENTLGCFFGLFLLKLMLIRFTVLFFNLCIIDFCVIDFLLYFYFRRGRLSASVQPPLSGKSKQNPLLSFGIDFIGHGDLARAAVGISDYKLRECTE